MSENHSQSDANKLTRVLSNKKLKYTVVIHRDDGLTVEFQSDTKPHIDFNGQARGLWIVNSPYDLSPIMAYEPDMVILCEENPV